MSVLFHYRLNVVFGFCYAEGNWPYKLILRVVLSGSHSFVSDSDVAPAVSLYYFTSFLFRVPQEGVAARVLANNTPFF